MKIDTGSDVNIIDEDMYKKIKGYVTLEKPKIKLLGYNSNTPLRTIGKFCETVEVRKQLTVATFYVVSRRSESLISAETAAALGLIKFANMITTKSSILQQYPDVFSGIGKLKGVQVQLHIDENIDPVAQPYVGYRYQCVGKWKKRSKDWKTLMLLKKCMVQRNRYRRSFSNRNVIPPIFDFVSICDFLIRPSSERGT